MPKYLSGRVKRTDQAYLSTDRYQYLGLEQAEPNLGDPPSASGSPGIPVGQRLQIISVVGRPGERFWIPVEGGLIPGSISVFEEGTLVGGPSSTTQLDFRGNIVTAEGTRTGMDNPGIAVTVSIAPPGTDGQILFNDNGDFNAATFFNYDNSTVGVASVGIGTSAPTQSLHINGNLRLEGTIFDFNNDAGSSGQILTKNNEGGLEYTNPGSIQAGAGGTISNIQFHDDTGLIDGASNFVYIELEKRVGIGSTQPKGLLDVLGDTNFSGINTFSNLIITGVLTASQAQGGLDFETDVRFKGANYNAEWDISTSSFDFNDDAKLKFGTNFDLQIYHELSSNSNIIETYNDREIRIRGSSGAGIATFVSDGGVILHHGGNKKFETVSTGAIVTGIFTATEEIRSAKITTIQNNFVDVDISGIATVTEADINIADIEQVRIGFATISDKLNVTGFTTTKDIFASGVGTFFKVDVDNIAIDGNKLESTSGNLILESASNTITINDAIFVNNSDDSLDTDTGSIISQGGMGIDKNLNVGGGLSVTGPPVGVAITLAAAGGIVTTGGDLYVGGNIFTQNDIILDDVQANSLIVTGLSTFVGLSTFNNGIIVESGISTFKNQVIVSAAVSVSDDVSITGIATVSVASSIYVRDTAGVIFGDDNDLKIYHKSGGGSYIEETGLGSLTINSNIIELKNADDDENLAKFVEGAQVELYHNNIKRLSTSGMGVTVTGITSTVDLCVTGVVTSNLTAGISNAFDLGSDASTWRKLYIKEIIGTEKVTVDEQTVNRLKVTGVSTFEGDIDIDANVDHDGNYDLSGGIIVGGISTFNSNVNVDGNVDLDGNVDHDGNYDLSGGLKVGGISTFSSGVGIADSIFHLDDTNTAIRFSANDTISFETEGTERFRIEPNSGKAVSTFFVTNAEDVIHITTGNNNGDTFANIRGDNKSGIRIRGGGSYGGGMIELAGGLRGTDPSVIRFFTGTDVTDNNSEKLRINTDGDLLRGGANQDIGSQANPWDNIYANNFYGQVLVEQTDQTIQNLVAGRLKVTGISTFEGNIFVGTGATVGFGTTAFFPDDVKIIFGDEDDFQISHTTSLANQNDYNGDPVTEGNRTASLIEEAGPGPMTFKSNGGDTRGAFQFFDADWRPILKLHSGNQSRVKLFYNSNLTLETQSYGALITGVTSTTDLYVSTNLRSNLIPKYNENLDLGSGSYRFREVYAQKFIGQIDTTQEETVTGNLLVTGISTFQGNIFVGVGATVGFGTTAFFPDDAKIIFGDNNDFEISHTTSLASQVAADGDNVTDGNQTASLIEDTGPGPMIFKSDGGGGPGAFQFFDNNWRPLIRMKSGGSELNKQVILYFNSEERIQTTGAGVSITGNLVGGDSSNFDIINNFNGETRLIVKDATNNNVAIATFTANTSKKTTFDSHVLPKAGDIYDLGSTELRWGTVFANEFNVSTVVDTDVLETGSINVTGLSTFGGLLRANGGADIKNIQIGVTDDNEIDTVTGNLTIDSAGGTTIIDDNFNVTGGNVDFNQGLNLSGGDGYNLTLGNKVNISGDGDASFVGVVTSKGLFVTGFSTITNDLLPQHSETVNIGAATRRFDVIFANSFNGVTSIDSSIIQATSLFVSGLSTFQGNVDIDGTITHDDTAFFNNDVYLGNSDADTITANAKFVTNLIPSGTRDLGSGANQWNNLYIDGTGNIDALDSDTAKVRDISQNEVVYVSDSTGELTGSSNLTWDGSEFYINGNLSITGNLVYDDVTNVDALGIITAGQGFRATTGGLIINSGISTFKDKIEAENVIQPMFGNSDNVGIQWKSDPGGGSGDKAYIRYYSQSGENMRFEIGIENDSNDDLYLKAPLVTTSGTLEITDNLTVNGNTTLGNAANDTVTFNADVNSNILPSHNSSDENDGSGKDLGASNAQWRKVYAREFSGAVTGNADTATKLATARSISITGDLSWSVNFDGSANVTNPGTLASTGVSAGSYGSGTQIPVITVDAKGRLTSATTTGLDITGATAKSATKITINPTNENQDFYLTFVTDSGTEKDVYVDGQLKYNPRGNVLTTRNIFPESSDTYDLGESNTNRWGNVYAENFRGGTFFGTIDDSVSAFNVDSNISEIFSRTNNTLSAIDPGTNDRLIFWDVDGSGGSLRYLSLGTSLSITGTTINVNSTDGGFLNDGTYGDIQVSGNGSDWQLRTGVVGSNELESSGVTPGTYNYASIDVDVDGRITNASSGSAAGGLSIDGTAGNILELQGAVLKGVSAGADKIVFWDNDGYLQYLTVGGGLQISGTTLSVNSSEVTTSAAGSNTEVQFNSGGNFAASSELTFGSGALTVGQASSFATKGSAITNDGALELWRNSDDGPYVDFSKTRIGSQDYDYRIQLVNGQGLAFKHSSGTRFTINNTGSWTFGGSNSNYGTVGQVLKSNANAMPSWENEGSGTSVDPSDTGNDANIALITTGGNLDDIFHANSNRAVIRASDGRLRVKGDIIAFRTSDIRYKDNVSPIKNALEKVDNISGNTFVWNSNHADEGVEEVGVIAQEVEKLNLPGLTETREDGRKAVRYELLIPLLVEAIKELKQEVDDLKSSK